MSAPTLLFKSAVIDEVDQSQILDINDDEGIVTAVVSVTGVVDEVDDIIEPGAYTETLRKRIPKVCWHHSWDHPIGRTLHIEELLPGDVRLPTKTRDGQPWPKEAGALVATMQLNLKSERGREAFEAIKFYSESGECEYSIGYAVPPGKSITGKDGIRRIKMLELFELSFVLFGAHTMTGTLALKAAAVIMEKKQGAGADTVEVSMDEVRQALESLGVTFDADGNMVSQDPAQDPAPAAAPDPAATDTVQPGDGSDEDPDPAVADADTDDVLFDSEDAYGDETAPEDLGPAGKALQMARDKRRQFKTVDGRVTISADGTMTVAGALKAYDFRVLGQVKDTNPGDESQGARELIHWYERGEGAAKIRWGEDGDFMRCVHIAEQHMTPEQAKGFCSNRHVGALGVRPGQEKDEVDEDVVEIKAVTLPETTAPADNRNDIGDDGTPDANPEDPKTHGVMVALYPDPDAAEQIAVRGGEKPEDLHITLAYMGNDTDGGTNGLDLRGSASQITAAVQIAAATHGPLSGTVGGLGKFPDTGTGVPVWAPVDVVGLGAVRESVVSALTDAGLPVKVDHGFTPHMTLGYNLDLDLIPDMPPVPVTFNALVVSIGEERMTVPLGVDAGADPSLAPPAGVEIPAVDDAPAVKAYDPTIEVGSEAGHRPPFKAERKDYPMLTGTIQERMDAIRCALEEFFLGGLSDDERDNHYVSMDGTWDDRVVATVNNWKEVGADRASTYELDYSFNDDGSVALGEPEEVRLVMSVVGDDDDEDAEADSEDLNDVIPPADLLPLPDMIGDVVRAMKACGVGREGKAGRVLSANNATRLKSAVENLISVLAAAGIEIGPAEPTPATVDTETTAPAAHGDIENGTKAIDMSEVTDLLANLTAAAKE